MSILTVIRGRASTRESFSIPRASLSNRSGDALGDPVPALDNLRYKRGSEPLPGHDPLSVEEILAALKILTALKEAGDRPEGSGRP